MPGRLAQRCLGKRGPPSPHRPAAPQLANQSLGEYFEAAIFEPASLNRTFYDMSMGQGRRPHDHLVWNGGYNAPIAVSAGGQPWRLPRWSAASACCAVHELVLPATASAPQACLLVALVLQAGS